MTDTAGDGRFPRFIDAVSRRCGLPPEQAAAVSRAVLKTMAERVTDSGRWCRGCRATTTVLSAPSRRKRARAQPTAQSVVRGERPDVSGREIPLRNECATAKMAPDDRSR
ncbi:hypothetical protein [Micromonospora sp. NPDC049204]|uniref:hypothetical protein n=1 Tax=Micromonospora sp. NPDC049204 TaxID=3154351 RepID=UPI00340786F0